MSRSSVGRFAALFHYRWAAPVLAELHRSSGCKFVTLVQHLGLSRDTLRRTLQALVERRWVMRNPGYGHPLRPEYVLTRAGARLGPWCGRLMVVLRALGIEDVALHKWSLAVAFALGSGRRRFSELKAFLPGLTARALTLTLKELQDMEMIHRVVVDAYPPTAAYHLTRRGRRLIPLLEAFDRLPR